MFTCLMIIFCVDIHLNQTSQESIATTVSQPSDSLKRKREDDDYDAF